MAATLSAQQAAQEEIGQAMASPALGESEPGLPDTPKTTSATPSSDSEPEEDEVPVGTLVLPEIPEVSEQTQAAYAHMRANAGGGAGYQPGA